jgi:PHD/YefM family antitoxin component YafN of YafNO toxin-antitoxin module
MNMYQSVSVHKPDRDRSLMEMTKKSIINASELHRAAGKMLKRVALQDEHLVVERDGYPVAVLLPYPEYEELMHLRAVEMHQELVRALGQEAERQGLSEEQVMAELEKDKRAVYKATYGSNPV